MLQQLELNTTGYYQIATGIQYYVPVSVSYREALIATAAHSNFFKNQNWSMRFWFSKNINGSSISYKPRPQLGYVDPLKIPVKFGLCTIEQAGIDLTGVLEGVQWLWPVLPDTLYYLNIQNKETRPNGFFLQLDTVSI